MREPRETSPLLLCRQNQRQRTVPLFGVVCACSLQSADDMIVLYSTRTDHVERKVEEWRRAMEE